VEHHQGVAGEGARAARLGKYEYERLRIKINYSDYFFIQVDLFLVMNAMLTHVTTMPSSQVTRDFA
jgi:hypothetical protein